MTCRARVGFPLSLPEALLHLPTRLLSGLAAFALLCTALFAKPMGVDDRLAPIPCWFTPPKGESALCATIMAPEQYDRPSARTLRLTVAVLRSTAAKPAADPVIFVEGGPGASPFGPAELTEERMESWWELSAPFRRTRDFVLFDPRGIGRSEPNTNCTELDGLAGPSRVVNREGRERDSARHLKDLPPPPVQIEAESAVEACAVRLQGAGVDLETFTTAAAADDIITIATALGATRFNLLAVSYGTRAALEVLRRSQSQVQESQVRALVLDAVYPSDVNAVEEEAWLTQRALRQLFDDCAASRSCRTAFPNLERRFLALAAALNASPVTVNVGALQQPLTVRLDGTTLIAAVLEAMAEDSPIRRLPALINQATRGRLEPLARYAPTLRLGDPDTAEGMAFSIECRETVNAADPLRSANNHHRWSVLPGGEADDPEKRVCAVWPSGRGPETTARQPVASAVPVLLFSGAYDPVTPPEWGAHAAHTLSQSQHMVFRATGHVVTASEPCARRSAARFIEQPDSAKRLACPTANKPPAFDAR